MKILTVQNLCKIYGRGEARVEALKNVSFSLEKGDFAAVIGESGSGKSTLLNCIGALDTPTSGTILMDGQNLFSMREEKRTIFRRRNIGFIFQSFQLVSELNVEQNIMFPLLLDYKKPNPAAIQEILELLGLTSRRHHLPNQLSGGQQQRVAIGRALITKPKLILADEPTGNLDSKNSRDVMELLTQASRHYQQTILMITHNRNLTASADRVFQVADGVLTDLGGLRMKHYLDLVPIAEKVHRKQSRMSVICIVLSVFLVTTIFGMADMFVRSQILQAQRDDGNWHIGLKNIRYEDAALMAVRPDIAVISPYGTLNFGANLGYTMGGKEVVIFGSDENCVTKIFPDMLTEGAYPQTVGGALVTENAREMMGLHIGDEVTVSTPEGGFHSYQVTGFLGNASGLMRSDAYGIFLCIEDYCTVYPDVTEGEPADFDIMYYVQFPQTGDIQGKIRDIKSVFQLSDNQVAENTKLLGLLGQSRDSFMMFIYAAAGILFVLVLCAGILMIASSLNSNVAQRIEFFGLMRCIGATPKQVMRLVRKEALNWCKFAIPAGVAAGIVVIWVLCAILRYLSPGYFSAMPAFGLSVPSVAAGVLVGLLTVLFAARSPAKRAAKASPLAAVSGNAGESRPVRSAANTKLTKVDTALGIHHAVSSRKNYLLMTGSFALSIVLFLSFSVTVDFMRHALTPLQPWTPDLSIVSPDRTCSVDNALLERLREIPAIKAAYGRMFAYSLPIAGSSTVQTVDLISYDANQFGWAKDYLLEGSLEAVQRTDGTGLVVKESDSAIQVGDVVSVQIGGMPREIEIVGILSDCPFSNAASVGIIICSEDSFRQMTGLANFTVIDIQLVRGASDSEVNAIHQMVGTQYTFSDERLGNSSTRGIYYCFNLFVYGFLVLIALITIFNVVNSIAMSVASRTKQYGAFRAIGLSTRQLSKMVVAEAGSYAASGIVAGTVVGMFSNRLLFGMLIGQKWGEAWGIPWAELWIILLIILVSIAVAVYGPIKRIHSMSIVDTISAQ